jgi:hypothetical protein
VLDSKREVFSLIQVKNRKETEVRMKSLNKYLLIFLVAVFGVSTNACKRNEQGEGAAEEAGKTIDKALERAGEATGRVLERAGEKMQEYGEKAKDTPPEKPAPATP